MLKKYESKNSFKKSNGFSGWNNLRIQGLKNRLWDRVRVEFVWDKIVKNPIDYWHAKCRAYLQENIFKQRIWRKSFLEKKKCNKRVGRIAGTYH
jgi:hypothetical protein